jgi:WD40 repeat protein
MSEKQTSEIRIDGNAIGSAIVAGDGNVVTVVYASNYVRSHSTSSPPESIPNPYRGLQSFDQSSTQYFFGREYVVERLLGRIARLSSPLFPSSKGRLLGIVGPSGTGKSSIVQAGLLPAIAISETPWLWQSSVMVLRPGISPLDSLADALARIISRESKPSKLQIELASRMRQASKAGSHAGLSEIVSANIDHIKLPLIIVVDQFEETYTQCRATDQNNQQEVVRSREERLAFVNSLIGVVTDEAMRVAVVIVMRSDFLGSLAEHPALSKLVAENNEIIPTMDRNDLRRAISEPAKKSGMPIDDSTIDRILDESDDASTLPLVEYALFQIWERMRDGVGPSDTLSRLGGVGGALAHRADQIIEALPSKHIQSLAKRAFVGTVQIGEGARDTRRRAWIDELLPEAVSETDFREATEPFVRERLLTTGADDRGRVWFELSHEALIRHWGTLRSWIDLQRDDLRFGQRLQDASRLWDFSGRPRGSLWRPPDLTLLQRYSDRNLSSLTTLQLHFLRASKSAVTIERNLRWGGLLTLVLLFFVAASLAFISINASERLKTERNAALKSQAKAAKLAIDQQIGKEGEPFQALQTVNENRELSIERVSDEYAKLVGSIYQAVSSSRLQPFKLSFHSGTDSGGKAIFSPRASFAYVISASNVVPIIDTNTTRIVRWFQSPDSWVHHFELDESEKTILVKSFGTWAVYDADRDQPRFVFKDCERKSDTTRGSDSDRCSVGGVGLRRDGRRVVGALADGTVMIWDAVTGDTLAHFGSTGDGAELSPDTYLSQQALYNRRGNVILSEPNHRVLRFWDAESHNQLSSIEASEAKDAFVYGRFLTDQVALLITNEGAELLDYINNKPISTVTTNKVKDYAIDSNAEAQVASILQSDGQIVIVRPDGAKIASWKVDKPTTADRLAISSSHNLICIGRDDGTIELYNLMTGIVRNTRLNPIGAITNLQFSPDGKHLLATFANNSIRLWNTDDLLSIAEITNENVELALVDHGVAAFDNNGHVRFYDEGGNSEGANANLDMPESGVRYGDPAFFLDPDQRSLLIENSPACSLFDLAHRALEKTLVNCMVFRDSWPFSQTGSILSVGPEDGKIGLFDRTKKEYKELPGFKEPELRWASFDVSGKYLIIENKDRSVTARKISLAEDPENEPARIITTVPEQASREGSQIGLTAIEGQFWTHSTQSSIIMWSAADANAVGSTLEGSEDVERVFSTARSDLVAAIQSDGRIKVWSGRSLKLVAEVPSVSTSIVSVLVAGNDRIAVLSSEGLLSIWSLHPTVETARVALGLSCGDERAYTADHPRSCVSDAAFDGQRLLFRLKQGYSNFMSQAWWLWRPDKDLLSADSRAVWDYSLVAAAPPPVDQRHRSLSAHALQCIQLDEERRAPSITEAELLIFLSGTRASKDQLDNRVRECDKLLEANSRSNVNWLIKSVLLYQQGKQRESFDALKTAASNSYAPALFLLGYSFTVGLHGYNGEALAMAAYSEAASQGSNSARVMFALLKIAKGQGEAGRCELAKIAFDGDPRAALILSQILSSGAARSIHVRLDTVVNLKNEQGKAQVMTVRAIKGDLEEALKLAAIASRQFSDFKIGALGDESTKLSASLSKLVSVETVARIGREVSVNAAKPKLCSVQESQTERRP